MSMEKLLEEIDRERKWLDEAGYTAYNIDLVFSSLCKNIKSLEHEHEQYYKDLANSYAKTINKLTKAISEQQPKTGHWIVDDFTGLIKCDICGNDAYMDTTSGEQCKSKYCPNCGARMESEDKE